MTHILKFVNRSYEMWVEVFVILFRHHYPFAGEPVSRTQYTRVSGSVPLGTRLGGIRPCVLCPMR